MIFTLLPSFSFLFLSTTPSGSKLGKLTVEKFFVGISGVRHADHLRIMPCNLFELEYLKKLSLSPRMRYWYNNYVASVTSGSQNPRWRWDSGRKFILPSIEPQFKKKSFEEGTEQYGTHQRISSTCEVSWCAVFEQENSRIRGRSWVHRHKRRLYDDHRKNERKRRR